MPWPEMAYITNARTRSRQPRPQPQAIGTAARRARNGTTMKKPRAICSPVPLRSKGGVPEVVGAVLSVAAGGSVSLVGSGANVVMARGLPSRTTYANVTYVRVG